LKPHCLRVIALTKKLGRIWRRVDWQWLN
jgi:hypothetical protein